MKKFLKNHVWASCFLAFLVILVITGSIAIMQSQKYEYRIYGAEGTITDIVLETEDESIIALEKIQTNPKETILLLDGLKAGTTGIFIHYSSMEDGDSIACTEYSLIKVMKSGVVFRMGEVFDYGGFQITYWGLTVFFGLMMIYFIWLRRQHQKEHYYSFRSIAFCAGILLFSIMFIIYLGAGLTALLLPYVQNAKLLIMITRNLMLAYSIITIPFMALFAIAMAISNIELIRHEGKSLTNMLGIGIAAALVLGTGLNLLLFYMNEVKVNQWPFLSVTYAIFSAGFTIFQTLLTGSIITCLQAARRKVPYNRDYIIILGCAIRDDGTLYPLLKGRVDCAIDFWKKQMEKNGKMAVFVPSGGKGEDEIISEGEAMERYLLEQGIPQKWILKEDQAATTNENMLFSKKLIDAQKENAAIAFATTNYHVFRSGFLADQIGVEAEGIGARTKWYFWPNAMIREVVGVFSKLTRLQWLFLILLILLAGLTGYGYQFLN